MKSICKLSAVLLFIALVIPFAYPVAATHDLSSSDIFDDPNIICTQRSCTGPSITEFLQKISISNSIMPINSVSTHSARNINRNSENPFGHYLATNVKTQGQVNVPAYSAIYDYSSDDKSLIISEMYEAYPGIEILGEPTGRYNCHSYA